MEKQNIWIRVAGNATNIKANRPHGWRCYVEGNSTEIPLTTWSVSGAANPENFIPGVNSKGDKHGIVAWIDCFGSYELENEVLHIKLQTPGTPPPTQ